MPALSTMKPFPKDDVGLLLVLTDDPQPEVRRYAVYALGSSHLEDPAIVTRLVKALQDPQTRDWATRALGNLGPAARGAVAELEAALQSDDLRVRLQAAEALWAVSQDVDKVLPVVIAIVEHDQGITVGGYSATTQIVDGKRVEKRHPYRTPLAQRAVELLGKMGPAAKPAAGMLETLLTHPDQSMQLRGLSIAGPRCTAGRRWIAAGRDIRPASSTPHPACGKDAGKVSRRPAAPRLTRHAMNAPRPKCLRTTNRSRSSRPSSKRPCAKKATSAVSQPDRSWIGRPAIETQDLAWTSWTGSWSPAAMRPIVTYWIES